MGEGTQSQINIKYTIRNNESIFLSNRWKLLQWRCLPLEPSPLLQSSYLIYLLICMERKLILIVFIYKIKLEGFEMLVQFITLEFVFIK